MSDQDCCTYECEENKHCPVRATRRVRAGQPAPPILLDPADIEDDDTPLSDAKSAVVVLVIIALVFVATAVIVGAV